MNRVARMVHVGWLSLLSSMSSCGGNTPEPVAPPAATAPVATASPHPEVPMVVSTYPKTRRDEVTENLHGTAVADPYRWLEEGASEDVKAWMKEQDAYARERLAVLDERQQIAEELRNLFYVESASVPIRRGKRLFYSRREAQKEKAAIYCREGKTGPEKLLLDPNTWSAHGTASLGVWVPSWDGRLLAYSVKANNSDEATLHVLDVATGKKSTIDVIEGAKYARPSFTPKGDGFYYTWLPTDPAIAVSERPGFAEVRFHKIGEDPKKDRVIREKTGDAKTFMHADVSKDGRWLVLYVLHGWSRSDVYFRDLKGKSTQFAPLAVGIDAEFDVDVFKDTFYVRTNDGAPQYRLFRVDPTKPARAEWKEIIRERSDATLQGVSIVGGKLSVAYLKDVSSFVDIHDLDGKRVRDVKLPGLGTSGVLFGNEDDDEAFYSFTSFTHPTEIFETSVKTGTTKTWFRMKLPVDPAKYQVVQVFAPSKDGTRVPLFVLHKKGFKRDGKAAAMLYGYGGFKNALTPSLRTSVFPWLDRGGIYVIANLRGGSEYGEAWHRAGMGHNKQNVFDDFIGVAEYLIREKYTRPDRLAIHGGSNGGLLVGAAMVQRPELFGVVLCDVPLLDMVRYHKFGSGKTWVEEYGSADNAEDFKTLFAYSPYHHVADGTRYPSLLMLSADSDDRVDPMHARKFTAAMQRASTGGRVLLRIERNAGHGGADLVKAQVEKTADMLAYALAELGPE